MRVVAGREQRGGAVLAAQAQLEGLEPGGGGAGRARRRAPARAARSTSASPDPGGRRPARRRRRGLPRPPPRRRRRPRARRTPARPGRRGPGGVDGLAQPADLGLPGLDPAAAGPHLAGELGQALAAVGGGAGEPGEACCSAAYAVSTSSRAATAAASASWPGRSRRAAPRPARARRPGRAAPRGRGRPGCVARLVLVLGEQPDAFGGQRPGRRETVAQAGSAPAFLRPGQLGRAASARPRARRRGSPRSVRASSTSVRRAMRAVSSATSCSSVAGELDEVVGQQPQAGVAGVGLDRRPPCARPRPGGPAVRAGGGSRR